MSRPIEGLDSPGAVRTLRTYSLARGRRFARACSDCLDRCSASGARRCGARPRGRCQVLHLARQTRWPFDKASACKMQDLTPGNVTPGNEACLGPSRASTARASRTLRRSTWRANGSASRLRIDRAGRRSKFAVVDLVGRFADALRPRGWPARISFAAFGGPVRNFVCEA